jgi:hypothetical protein
MLTPLANQTNQSKFYLKGIALPRVVVHTCNPDTPEAEAEESW